MLKIGITGGIGSGKTEICMQFQKLGITSINADEIAKNIIHTDKSVQIALKENFGESIFIEKKLNTKLLSNIVFSNKKKLEMLNSIVHPKTIEKLQTEILSNQKKNTYILIESAIIFETELEEMFDYILLVTSNIDLRIERVQQKAILSKEEILKRIKMQMSDDEKKKISDFVIENNGTKIELEEKVKFFHTIFKSISKTKN